MTDYFLAAGTMTAAQAVLLEIAPPERIRSIAPPIDIVIPADAEEARRAARSMLEIPVEALVVGTTARLDAQKAPLDMVRAFAALERRDVQMVWIGEGELRAETERLIKRKGIADRFPSSGVEGTWQSCFRLSMSSPSRASTRGCRVPSPRR